jgi:hypothetical protein
VVLQRADEYSGFMLGKMQDRIAAALAEAAEQQQQKGLQRRSSGATGVNVTRTSSAGALCLGHCLPRTSLWLLLMTLISSHITVADTRVCEQRKHTSWCTVNLPVVLRPGLNAVMHPPACCCSCFRFCWCRRCLGASA